MKKQVTRARQRTKTGAIISKAVSTPQMDAPQTAVALRRQAKVTLIERKKKTASLPTDKAEIRKLFQELRVHQIELEMQNEELTRARVELETLLRQYADLYDFAPVGYFTLALDGTINQVNLAGAKLLGVERGALIKRRFESFVLAKSRTTFHAFLDKVFANASKETCEIAIQIKGADPVWTHIEAISEDGQECRAVVIDITERREIEIGLEKTRKELAVIKIAADEVSEYAESIINTVREPLIVLDQDLRVVSVSRSFYEFFKVNPEETVGQLIYDLGNKQWDIPKLRELLENILPKKAAFDNYEVEHDFATIGRRIMLLNARQIERASGKERIILLAIEDITERREIETGLEKTRKELEVIKKSADEASEFAESIINTVREPLISLDQDLRVVTVSRSFYEFFKVKPEETVGQLIYDLGNKQWDIPKLRELLETILPQKDNL